MRMCMCILYIDAYVCVLIFTSDLGPLVNQKHHHCYYACLSLCMSVTMHVSIHRCEYWYVYEYEYWYKYQYEYWYI
jgi:hypothetical protein